MEVASIPDKSDILREFFSKQGIEVCDSNVNPCIDPVATENNKRDNRKLAKRLKTHFVLLLLAWWKATHYVYIPDTRMFYRRSLLQLISGNGKLFQWPSFVKVVHIDAINVTIRKDNPRVWLEYVEGYEFLTEDEANKKSTVTV